MKVLLIVAALLLAGCANSSQDIARLQQKFSATIPVCKGATDCPTSWDAAQLWVVHNANFKIQIANNVLIETYNHGYNAGMSVRVTKEPVGEDKYAILVFVSCASCGGNELVASQDFNDTINRVLPPQPKALWAK